MDDTSGRLVSTLGRAAIAVAVVAVTSHFALGLMDGAVPPAAHQDHQRPAPRAEQARPDAPGGGRILTLNAGEHGHFWLDGAVDRAAVTFLVDTGATAVALDAETARAAGFRLTARDFTLQSHTANGIARAAPVTIRRLRAGPITLRNVDGVVHERSMDGIVLLGMSFLGRLEGYEVRGERMMLRW